MCDFVRHCHIPSVCAAPQSWQEVLLHSWFERKCHGTQEVSVGIWASDGSGLNCVSGAEAGLGWTEGLNFA